MKIFIIDGPNINLLGVREPMIYGNESYLRLKEIVLEWGKTNSVDIVHLQSNVEGEIVNFIQKAYFENADGIVINPAAYTHTSIAIMDALKAVKIPTVEVHISDISTREEYRQISLIKECAILTISGEGISGYVHALDELKKYVEK